MSLPAWIGDCTYNAAYIAHFLGHKKNKNKQYFIYIYFVKVQTGTFWVMLPDTEPETASVAVFLCFWTVRFGNGCQLHHCLFRVLLDLSTYGRVKSSTFKAASQPGNLGMARFSPACVLLRLVFISQHGSASSKLCSFSADSPWGESA